MLAVFILRASGGIQSLPAALLLFYFVIVLSISLKMMDHKLKHNIKLIEYHGNFMGLTDSLIDN